MVLLHVIACYLKLYSLSISGFGVPNSIESYKKMEDEVGTFGQVGSPGKSCFACVIFVKQYNIDQNVVKH